MSHYPVSAGELRIRPGRPYDLPGMGDYEPDYPEPPAERTYPNPNYGDGDDPWSKA